AALEDHPVDRAGAAEQLSARVIDATAVQVRLRLGLVPPVGETDPARGRPSRRHVDEDVEGVVRAAGLEDENAVGGVGGEPGRQAASGRAPAADHESVRAGTTG